jgi:predicted RNA binding protein YcfA (HicA-like mRNA interferase family)
VTKLPLCSSDQIIKALIKDGFHQRGKSKAGSHQAFVKDIPNGRKRVVPIPIGKREIPIGTLVSILRLAGITRERFLELL